MTSPSAGFATLRLVRGNRPPEDAAPGDLARLAAGGDFDAFEAVVRRYQRRVYGLAYQYVRDLDEAQDVAQEIFFRLHQNLARFDPARAFDPWFWKLAANVCLNYTRKRIPEPHAAGPIEPRGETDAADSPLQLALGELDPAFRLPLLLHYYAGLPIEEIAAAPAQQLCRQVADVPRPRHAAPGSRGRGVTESECHELRQRLEPLVDGELDQETAARLEAHLRACSGCSKAYEEAVSLPFRLRALKAPEPPPALVPAVMRAWGAPASLDQPAVWTRPVIWAPLLAEGGLAGIIGLYLSGLAGVAALARATVGDLGALWGWGVGSSTPPSDFSADLVVVGALLLMVVTIYHLAVLVRQRAQERGRQT